MLEFKVIQGGVFINTITLMAESENSFVLHVDTDERWPEFDGAMYGGEEVTLFLCPHAHSPKGPPTRITFKAPGEWAWGAIGQPMKYGLQVVLYKTVGPSDEWETIWVNPELVEKHRMIDEGIAK